MVMTTDRVVSAVMEVHVAVLDMATENVVKVMADMENVSATVMMIVRHAPIDIIVGAVITADTEHVRIDITAGVVTMKMTTMTMTMDTRVHLWILSKSSWIPMQETTLIV